ncbi:hypothetical protein ACFVHQ_12670 [Actinomycetes bacterium NPDC127524]
MSMDEKRQEGFFELLKNAYEMTAAAEEDISLKDIMRKLEGELSILFKPAN